MSKLHSNSYKILERRQWAISATLDQILIKLQE